MTIKHLIPNEKQVVGQKKDKGKTILKTTHPIRHFELFLSSNHWLVLMLLRISKEQQCDRKVKL